MAQDAVERLERARPGSTAVDVAWSTYERDRETGGGLLAGALAYRFFFMLLPLIFLLVVGLGLADSADNSAPGDAAREFGMSGAAASAVADSATLSHGSQIVAVVTGTIALLWAARGVLRAARLVHAIAWGKPERRFGRVPAGSLATVGFVLLALVIVLASAWLRDRLGTGGLMITIGTVILFAGFWVLASLRLPRGRGAWTALVPGAIVVAVGFQGIHLLTVLWISHKLESASAAYGALGVALVLLLWLYLLGRLIVISAMLNATISARQSAGD
jgi:membrane protein